MFLILPPLTVCQICKGKSRGIHRCSHVRAEFRGPGLQNAFALIDEKRKGLHSDWNNSDITIHQWCKRYRCVSSYISWDKANKYCRSKGVYLPFVHSTRDTEIILSQVYKYQCEMALSKIWAEKDCVNLFYAKTSEDDLDTYAQLYQTIGIYLGLNTQVCLL